MPRTVQPSARREKYRDCAMIVIAAEGSETERLYFEGLRRVVADRRIDVRFVPRAETSRLSSSPKSVLTTIQSYRKSGSKLPNDEYWIVLDRDRWPPHAIFKVLQQAQRSQIKVVLSNPCFEVFLHSHYESYATALSVLSTSAQGTVRSDDWKRYHGQAVSGTGADFSERYEGRLGISLKNCRVHPVDPKILVSRGGTNTHLILMAAGFNAAP